MIVRQVTNRLQEGGLRESAVRISKLFGDVVKAKLKIIVQVIYSTSIKISIIQGNEKIPF